MRTEQKMQGKGSTLDAAIRNFVLDRQIGGCTRATLDALTEEHLRKFLFERGKAEASEGQPQCRGRRPPLRTT
jgi:hypothetical protein